MINSLRLILYKRDLLVSRFSTGLGAPQIAIIIESTILDNIAKIVLSLISLEAMTLGQS